MRVLGKSVGETHPHFGRACGARRKAPQTNGRLCALFCEEVHFDDWPSEGERDLTVQLGGITWAGRTWLTHHENWKSLTAESRSDPGHPMSTSLAARPSFSHGV